MVLKPKTECLGDGNNIHLLIRCVSWDQFQPVLASALQRRSDATTVVVENNAENLDCYPESVETVLYEGDFYEASQLREQLANITDSGLSYLTIPMANAWGIRYGELLEFADMLPATPLSLVDVDDLQAYSLEDVRAKYAFSHKVLQRSRSQLQALKDSCRGQRCFILGNGRSLNTVDMSRLEKEYTFGVNGIFYAQERLRGMTTFYTAEDNLFIERNAALLKQLSCRYCFYPLDYLPVFGEADSTIYLDWQPPSLHTRLFSTDSSQKVYCGYSAVFINLQLAWHLGFDPVYLIGVDLDYDLDVESEADVLLADGEGTNHFHSEYHQKGVEWYRPKTKEMYRSFQMARDAFRADEREIYKASSGGKLDLFEEVDFNELF